MDENKTSDEIRKELLKNAIDKALHFFNEAPKDIKGKPNELPDIQQGYFDKANDAKKAWDEYVYWDSVWGSGVNHEMYHERMLKEEEKRFRPVLPPKLTFWQKVKKFFKKGH